MTQLLTINEVANYIRAHPKTIYRWKREGRIPYVETNGLVRFNKNDIEEWVKKRSCYKGQFVPLLPRVDSLEAYDKLMLKGRSALRKKGSKRWNYGFGGVYTRKTKSGTERWCVWFYDENRKRIQKVIKNAKNRQEAVLALHVEVANAYKRQYQSKKERPAVSFKEFSEIYLENYARPKKRSWRSDKMYLDAQLIPFFGQLILSEITPFHVSQFIVKRKHDGVRNSTVNRELTVLKKMLNLAIEWNFAIESNPVKKANYFPEDEYKRERILTSDEERRLFNSAAPHLRAILACALSTGMRLSEILKLRWEDVDHKNKQIKVKAQSSKSGKQRVIPVNADLFSVLRKQMELYSGASDYVFLYEDPATEKLRPVKTVRRAFTKACMRAKIENLRFHDLRHTFGSRLIEKGADPVSVKDLLGHANLKTTEIYLHSSIGRMREAVEMLDSKPGKNAGNFEELLLICNAGKREKGERRTNVLFSVN
jgi:excisionase family DNA binding protein